MAEHARTSLTLNLLAVFALWTAGVWCQMVSEGHNNYNCKKHAVHQVCGSSMKVDDMNILESSKKEDLEKLCPHYERGIRCIDEYAKRCFPPEQRRTFNKLYAGTSMVLHEICQEGPYQNRFLVHSPCMLLNSEESNEKCAKPYQLKVHQIFNTSKKNESIEPQKEEYCCSLYKYLNCSKDIVLRDCGQEAADFAVGFVRKMASPLLEDYCETFPSERCRWNGEMSAGWRWEPPPVVALILCLLPLLLLGRT